MFLIIVILKGDGDGSGGGEEEATVRVREGMARKACRGVHLVKWFYHL